MFQIPFYDDANGKRMQQKQSTYWWTYVLNTKCVAISKALDSQSRLSFRWSHILYRKYHDVCLQFVIAVFPDHTHYF